METVVIGCGASGLVAAIVASRRGVKTTIIEQNKIVGKKILVTGNGRCNFYNINQDVKKYHTSNEEEMKIIHKKAEVKVLDFFDDIGVIPRIKEGYYYPVTNQASTIRDALYNEAIKCGVNIITDTKVTKIEKKEDFIIYTNNGIRHADKVIVSTGGLSQVKNYNGYDLVTNLGHTKTKLYPSLVSVNGCEWATSEWDGVRSIANLTLVIDGEEIRKEEGEVQFTKTGISGICVFNLSSYIGSELDKGREAIIYINLVPWLNQEFKEFMISQDERLNNYSVREILEGFLNKKLVNLICKINNINNERVSEIDLDKLASTILKFPFKVDSINSFDASQVTKGGVPLSEINANTMESKIVSGLYLTGEILDVDGECGGYNLGFAWLSGIIAGENV